MNLVKLKLRVTIAMASFLLVGCGDLLAPVKEPEQAQYTINPGIKGIDSKSSTNKTLQVAKVTVEPGFRTTKMAYVRQPYQLEYFTRNRWVADPNRLLQQPIINALQASGYYRQVVNDHVIAKTDQRLVCNLVQLYQNYLAQPSQIHLVMQAQLINNRTQHIIASKQFKVVQTAPFDTPYGGVLATNQAVAKLQQQLVNFVVKSTNRI